MPGIQRLIRRLGALFRRAELEREMDEELRAHLEMEREELTRNGLTAEEARRRALVAFGGVERTKEEGREERGFPWLEDLAQDVRYALRGLARTPGFTMAVVVTLALAIGANATMFGIVDRLLLRGPEHVRDAGMVRRVYRVQPNSRQVGGMFAYPTYTDLRDGVAGLSGAAAYTFRELAGGRGADARLLRIQYATASLFPLLGVEPALGRFYGADEDRPPYGERVAVLDYGYWRRQYGGDPGVVGRRIDVLGVSYTVVGVAPRGFTGAELRPVDVWLPMSTLIVGTFARPPLDWPTLRGWRFLSVVVRLGPGSTAARAGAAATVVHRRAGATDRDDASSSLELLPVSRGNSGEERAEASVARWLAGVTAVVMLIACANIANLLLARATRRRREVAVRLALGAGRSRLARLLLTESLVLALVGGVAALVVTYWGAPLLRAVLLPDVAFGAWPVGWRVLAVAAALALGAGVVTGLVPALGASRPDVTASLKAGSLQGGSGHSWLPSGLVVAQAALAFVLLVGAALFLDSLRRAQAVDLGVEPSRVRVAMVAWPNVAAARPEEAIAEYARRRTLLGDVVERLAARPWVEHASLAMGAPFLMTHGASLRVPGLDSIPPAPGGGPFVAAVSHDYFATVGTRLLRGRVFTPADRAGSERVATVNEVMARTLWPGQDALGKCMVIFADSLPCARVVGVVANANLWRLQESPAMQYHVPLGQEVAPPTALPQLLVRPRARDAERAAELLRNEIRSIEPSAPYVNVRVLDESLDGEMRPWRLGASLFTLFGLLALVVTVVGLYSVIAYVVEQRHREFAVRIALGARNGDVFGQTLRRGLAPALLGLPAGLVIALAAGRFVEPLLFETSARDVRILGLVALVLLVVAVVASLIPAIRATRVNPAVALQAE